MCTLHLKQKVRVAAVISLHVQSVVTPRNLVTNETCVLTETTRETCITWQYELVQVAEVKIPRVGDIIQQMRCGEPSWGERSPKARKVVRKGCQILGGVCPKRPMPWPAIAAIHSLSAKQSCCANSLVCKLFLALELGQSHSRDACAPVGCYGHASAGAHAQFSYPGYAGR